MVSVASRFGVTYELNVHATTAKAMGALYAALHRNILDVFNEQGVQIMTPAYENDPIARKVVAPNHESSADAGQRHADGAQSPATR
jgi:small-conductance mechanosensitive channel